MEPDPATVWARSGAMALCGHAGATPRLGPAPVAAWARRAVHELGERAAILGLARRGRTSPGGRCRLLRAADGWLAVNLARADDERAVPAWLETECSADDIWSQVERHVVARHVDELVARARLLALPIAAAPQAEPAPPPAVRVAARGEPAAAAREPLVVDLSALWAGPLCAHLLGLAGARVVKVESTRRPDGARSGARFFDLLNAGKRSVALDLERAEDRAALRRLLERADVVIESARPRALGQLGIEAQAILARRPGLVWVSITGYGRGSDGVAFGDDAACAAGLAAAAGDDEGPLFGGDAIADPLAGIVAALAAYTFMGRGGGVLLDVSLRGAAAAALASDAAPGGDRVRRRGQGWVVEADSGTAPVSPPRARRASAHARPLGADTRALLSEVGIAC